MKRTALKRRTPLRTRRREKRPRVARPGPVPRLPSDWLYRCRLVRLRDKNVCRWCAQPLAPRDLGAVDHLIPRRLAGDRVRDAARNLALLCSTHHSGPKAEAEIALFKGQSDRWIRFLNIVHLTGPRPTPDEIGAALTRLNALRRPMMDTETLPHVELTPPGPDLPGQVAQLQRKAERHKAALARLEKALAQTKTKLQQKAEECELAVQTLDLALMLLQAQKSTEATRIAEEALAVIRYTGAEANRRTFAAARRRDTALGTLRAKVKTLHAALTRAKTTIRRWHGMNSRGVPLGNIEPETWALYQDSPEMQEINRALEDVPPSAAGGSP